MGYARRDQNFITTATAVSSVDGVTPVELWADPTTHRLLVDSGGGYITPTSGVIDGSNATYVWNVAPSVIVVDQGRTMQKVNSAPDSGVNWTGTTTTVLTVAPTFDIFGLS